MPYQKINLEILKMVRKSKKVKQKDLASILGYSNAAGYQHLEKGRNRISAEQLKKIADYLQIDSEIFFTKPFDKTYNNKQIV